MRRALMSIVLLMVASCLASGAYAATTKFAQIIYGSDYDPDPGARTAFVNEFNSRTSHTAEFVGFLYLYELDPSIDLVWITGHDSFTFTQAERDGIIDYLGEGGVIWGDDCSNEWGSPWCNSFVTQINAILGVDYFTLPTLHPVYHSFYDLDGSPPTEWDTTPMVGWNYWGATRVFLSEQDYMCGLNGEGTATTYENSVKMAVNLSVYSMFGDATPTPTASPTPAPVPASSLPGAVLLIGAISLLLVSGAIRR